jgi:hypothetical protein
MRIVRDASLAIAERIAVATDEWSREDLVLGAMGVALALAMGIFLPLAVGP